MLVQLRIRDFVLIDELDLEFPAGFIVLTGETGAGKSLIATALNLLLGHRGSGEAVRLGAQIAEIEGLFDISDEAEVRDRLTEAGLPADDELVIRRVIPAEGRHRCYVNGRLSSLSLLSELSVGLAHIMSQHEQHSLGDPAKQISFLDGFGALEKEVSSMANLYERVMDAKRKLSSLRDSEANRTGRLDYIAFQLDEMDTVDPQPGELVTIEKEVDRLRNAERLTSTVRTAASELYESDHSVYDRIGAAIRNLEGVADFDDSLEGPKEQLSDAAVIIEDAARFFSQYGEADDVSDERVARLEDRLDALRRIVRKHNTDLDGVLALRENLREEAQTLERFDEAIADAEQTYADLVSRAESKAASLSRKRKSLAKKLALAVTNELKDLSLDGAQFFVDVHAALGLGSRGADQVAFRVRLNPGEGAHPIAKIASGGELSRLMLAVKRALLGVGPAGTYVFDEVDAGIGGAVAAAVGKKLFDVSKKHQVMCITHLPQIAGMADGHFKVSKTSAKKRTITRIESLGQRERVEELSRMLGGEKITSKTRAAARELLKREAAS